MSYIAKTAATFVVSNTPKDGDYTSIAVAANALPAGGGEILVRDGTYSISATITLPVDKPVVIRGCGSGTIISLGANAIAAFTIPASYTSNTPIKFIDLKVTGTEVATQTLLLYGDNNGLAEIYIENVTTTGVELTIDSNSTSSASSTPGHDDPRFHLLNCRIRPNTTNNSVILHNSSFGLPRAWLTEVEFIGDSLFAIPGGRTAPLFGRLADDTWFGDCYLDSCELSVGTGEHDFATFETVDSTVWNNDNVNRRIIFYLNGNFEGLAAGTVASSSFRGIEFGVFENTNFESNLIQDSILQLFGAGTVIADNQIIGVTSGIVTSGFTIQVNNENMVIRANRFRPASRDGALISLQAPCTVHANDFSATQATTISGSIFLDNSDAIVTDNRFAFAPTSGRTLAENNGPNYYDNNVMLFNNQTNSGGVITSPILPAVNGSTVQGTLGFIGTGSIGGTNSGNVQVVWYRNLNGLAQVKGYVQNTGLPSGFQFLVRETFATQNQGVFTRDSASLASGQKVTLDPYDFSGTISGQFDFQVVDYRVSLFKNSGTIGFTRFFPAPGGVTGT